MTPAQRSNDPRDNTSSALLEEIEPVAPIVVVEQAAAPASVSSEENDSSPSSGSYVHIESETVTVGDEGVTVETVVVDAAVDPPEEVAE